MAVTTDQVLDTLRGLTDPVSGQDIVTAGLVRALHVDDSGIRFVLEIDPKAAKAMEPVRARAEEMLRALPGAGKVSVLMTAHSDAAPPDLKPKAKASGPQPIPGVRHVIAVASGKGGVGKSTVSANLATALAAEGRRVGLLDADVYGPSQPRMLGLSGRPESDGKLIRPLVGHGVKLMSLGLLVQDDQAIVWRGPMLMTALQQMLFQVEWGELDALIVDLPPGTGDVQLTLAQKVPMTGAIVVSTPQDIALLDARKGLDMFQKTKVPVIGLIENMSTHICSQCGHEEHIFGHGGVADEAARLGVPLLAELPLTLAVRVAGDSGTPIVVAEPDSAPAQTFRALARSLVAQGLA